MQLHPRPRHLRPLGGECLVAGFAQGFEERCAALRARLPALNRRATIGFFVYPEAQKSERRQKMGQFASEALEREGAQVCVIFGKNADKWADPYEVVLLAETTGAIDRNDA